MRTIAWDGVVLDVPANWELARYRYPGKGRVQLGIEDEYASRIDLEWMEPPADVQALRFTERATESLEALLRKADRQVSIGELPPGWRATHCLFREVIPVRRRKRGLGVVAHDLVTAIYAPADRRFRCVIRLHFMPGDQEDPVALTRAILASFRRPEPAAGQVLWQVFDLSFRLDAAFRLESTTFSIGSKLMVFRRAGRRLYLWTLSCADRLPVTGGGADEWIAGYLNGTRRVTGIVFRPGVTGGIIWKRRGLLALVHRDELARWCFKYAVDKQRLEGRNQLLITVFNHRHPEDLGWLQGIDTNGLRQ